MNRIEPHTLGFRRHVCFKVAQIDVVTASVDLLVVGMSEQDVAAGQRGGASQLDLALRGTLGRLREGGIFDGRFGETLMLSKLPAPIAAGALLLVGMGQAMSADLAGLTYLAMRGALRIKARRAACLLGWSELDIPPSAIVSSATSMMHGALRAIDDLAASHDTAIGGNLPGLEWIFDIRNGAADRTAAALTKALAAWR